MKKRAAIRILSLLSVSVMTVGFSACSSLFKGSVVEPSEEIPAAPLEVKAPELTGARHPIGLQIGDVIDIFVGGNAPDRKSAEMKTCDADFRTLEKKTHAKEELKTGVLELIRRDPVRYHWCFYSKILELEAQLRSAQMLDERQKAVVDSYRFLSLLSRAFFREYKDSRYLNWAVNYYKRASELAFYRRVETSPALTQELIGNVPDTTNRGLSAKPDSVLQKYGIVAPEPVAPQQQTASQLPVESQVPSTDIAPAQTGIPPVVQAPEQMTIDQVITQPDAVRAPASSTGETFPAETPF